MGGAKITSYKSTTQASYKEGRAGVMVIPATRVLLLGITAALLSLTLTAPTICIAQQEYPDDYLQPPNQARQDVGVGPLVWDETAAAYAKSYADQRAGDCQLVHSGGPYGENLFWWLSSKFTAAEAVESWVDEKQFYDYDSNSCADGETCGHYTHVVWQDSAKLGCARVVCTDGGVFIICNYDPAGNFVGQHIPWV